ncbi:hypothetical protein N825_27065 [Skermanella stibiiresistens SB22]|uniref:Calcium-binding protein n=1 Tax=Skermanella stibiiresistens SB22 TaxID=1385369 RepID=W9GRL8_9PROT|nr:calcium-binding protein [Skermanella stibiiresistens]EWY36409.1 hypothetical protein N825_27065 [Skermanella stibiiresistens SB22]
MALIFGHGRTTVWGTRWADEIHVGGRSAAYGQSGNDRIFGDDAANHLVGQTGNDSLFGRGGDDFLDGGRGNDHLYGEAGNDLIWGGAGNDFLVGGSGNDRVRGDAGNDTIVHDVRVAGLLPAGTDEYTGGAGADTLIINVRGQTETYGAAGPEIRIDDHGNGVLAYTNGPIESDFVRAATFTGIEVFHLVDDSNPLIFRGGALDATVIGGAGDDVFEGGEGDETFTGLAGNDQFLVLWRPGLQLGHDVIHGFNPVEDSLGKNSFDEDYSGPDPLAISAVERGGHTFYTFTDANTHAIVGTLDVDAVGLPPIGDYLMG